jgi:hypothetical protein
VRLDDEGLGAAIQLLGATQLIGWRISRTDLFGAPLDRVAELAGLLKHRPEVRIVEQWQRQLWLGLRVSASIGPGQLQVNPGIVLETLDRWRRNIDEGNDWAGIDETLIMTAQRINISMVNWLEACARTRTGRLVPSQEPLWVLSGFPRHLQAP